MKLSQQLFTLYFCSWHFSQLTANICLELVGKSCGGKEGDHNTQKARQDTWDGSKTSSDVFASVFSDGLQKDVILMCAPSGYYCQWSWSCYWDHSLANLNPLYLLLQQLSTDGLCVQVIHGGPWFSLYFL